jgi:hypothetical protein
MNIPNVTKIIWGYSFGNQEIIQVGQVGPATRQAS